MPHAELSPPGAAPTIDGVTLYVNDGPLAASEVLKLPPSRLDEDMSELRTRFEKDGYLFLEGLIPREDVLTARGAYFRSLAHTGVLKPSSDPVDGLFDPAANPSDYPGLGAGQDTGGVNGRPGGSETAAAFIDAALQQHTAPWYWNEEGNGFAQHPVLRRFVENFSGWGDKTTPVMRTLLRNNTPSNKAIGVHYDQTFMRYGEPTSVTAWVPLGDISLQGGGLIYLEDGEWASCELIRHCNRTLC